MDIKEILTISGKSGLYKLVSNKSNAFIVESLADGKRMPAFARDKVSPLEEISIFTDGDDMPLREVFVKLYLHQNKQPIDKAIVSDSDKLKDLFAAFVPTYDRERLYVSHMKKIVTWYNELLEHNLIDEEEPKQEGDNADNIDNTETVAEKLDNNSKQTVTELKKTAMNKTMPKNVSTKKAAPSKTISTKPKAK